MWNKVTPILYFRRLRFRVGCASATIIISTSTIFVLHAAEARRWVIGPADPKTGTRIRYSISPEYEKKPIPDEVIGGDQSVAERFRYWPGTPPGFVQWLEDHRLFRSGRESQGDGLTFVASVLPATDGWRVDKDGFVENDVRRAGSKAISRVVSQEKRLVAGCPTTLLVEDLEIVGSGYPAQSTLLVLHPRGGGISYLFEADGVKGEEDDPDVRELKAIRD